MGFRQRQSGSSMYVFLYIAATLGLFFLVGLKLFPYYFDYYSTKKVIDNLEEDTDMQRIMESDLREKIQKKLNINQAYTVPANAIYVEKYDGGMLVELDYEVREPLFYNIEAVMVFEHSAEFEVNN